MKRKFKKWLRVRDFDPMSIDSIHGGNETTQTSKFYRPAVWKNYEKRFGFASFIFPKVVRERSSFENFKKYCIRFSGSYKLLSYLKARGAYLILIWRSTAVMYKYFNTNTDTTRIINVFNVHSSSSTNNAHFQPVTGSLNYRYGTCWLYRVLFSVLACNVTRQRLTYYSTVQQFSLTVQHS